VTPEGQIYDQNSKFWQFWGLYSHISAPVNMKCGTGKKTFGPLSRAKFHVYRGNVSPLLGEKPIFGLLSNNNTSMAALCAGLPVKIYYTHSTMKIKDIRPFGRQRAKPSKIEAWSSQPTCKNCSSRTFVHHYTGTQHCSTETVLLIPLIQTNITSQMWPRGGKGENKPTWKNVRVYIVKLYTTVLTYSFYCTSLMQAHTHTHSLKHSNMLRQWKLENI